MESWLLPLLVVVIVLLTSAALLMIALLARRGRATKPSASVSLKPSPSVVQPSPHQRGIFVAPTPAAFLLIGLTGALQGQRLPVGPNGLTLGRNPDNDVVLRDELMVSRYHAEITGLGDRFVLRDLESANGTWVDGRRIVTHVLTPGNHIRLGSVECLFVDATAQTQQPNQQLNVAQPGALVPLRSDGGAYFEGFWLERLVGQGGMSMVYKAHTPEGQVVALKILQSADPYLVQKFEAEGNTIGPLLQNHPHIVNVHAFQRSADGHLYLVMDYVDGCSLRSRLGQGPMTQDEIIQILGQACDALGYAHAANVVHRDVKPENILIQRDGHVKVVDFGIARLTTAMTMTQNKLVGTPEYMSPEQARGEPVSAASDVYSLGIVLYEMLTGVVPFPLPASGNDWRAAMTVVDQHLHAAPVPPRQRVSTISSDLEQVALRSLEKSWQKRYRDGAAMGQALEHRPSPARRTPPPKLTPANAKLIVVEGPAVGRQWALAMSPLVIGRGDLDPDDVRVSRRHLQIEWREGHFWLQDLSVNGTWVNQTRVADGTALTPDDLIAIGASVLQFQQ